MSEPHKQTTAGRSSFARYLVVAIAAALAGFGAVYVTFGPAGNGTPEAKLEKPQQAKPPAATRKREGLAAFSTGEMIAFVAKATPVPVAAVNFRDGNEAPKTIADWRGKVVLLNLWATWCGPCRHEMPDLDALQAEFGGDRVEVVAISADRQGPSVIGPFYDEVGVKHLAHYNDKTMKTHRAFRSLGLPTTILLDAEGRELGRLIGPAEWAAPEAVRLVRYFVDAAGS